MRASTPLSMPPDPSPMMTMIIMMGRHGGVAGVAGAGKPAYLRRLRLHGQSLSPPVTHGDDDDDDFSR
jgi:hypothetical protein